MSYQSPYGSNPNDPDYQASLACATAAYHGGDQTQPGVPATAPRAIEESFPPGSIHVGYGIFLGPPRDTDNEIPAPNNDAPQDPDNDQNHEYTYPPPSPGHYTLPPTHAFTDQVRTTPEVPAPPRPVPLLMKDVHAPSILVSHPPGSSKYYVLECLPCNAAFDSVAGALVHFTHRPEHVELRGLVDAEIVMDICGCEVVDATKEDWRRLQGEWRKRNAAAGMNPPPQR